jgi:hypothetical protein
MDTNKILFIVLGLIIFMVIMNNIVIITPTQSQVVPVPVPVPVKTIGGCAGTRYGCCPNGTTPKASYLGANCNL